MEAIGAISLATKLTAVPLARSTVMRKPPPSPILWGLLTPLQKRAPIAASTALPFLARMSRPTLAQGFESTDTAPCKKRPSLLPEGAASLRGRGELESRADP